MSIKNVAEADLKFYQDMVDKHRTAKTALQLCTPEEHDVTMQMLRAMSVVEALKNYAKVVT